TVGSLRERENVTATVGSRIGGVGGELRYGVSGRIPRQQHQSCLSVRRQSATIDRFLSTRVRLLCEQTGREQPAHVWEKLSGPAARRKVDHFAIGVDNFNKDSVTADLKARGATPIDQQGGGFGFHVLDPDGFPVQIS